MKLHHHLPLLALSAALLPLVALSAVVVPTGDDPALAAPTVPAADFSAFKTADEFWAHFETLQKQPTDKPASREAAMTQAQTWFGAQQQAGEAFAKAFPTDTRRWQAKLIALRAGGQMRRLAGQSTDMAAERARLDEIIAAADAPVPVQAEAAFLRAMTLTADFKVKPESYLVFHQAAADFATKYAANPLAPKMQELDLRVLADDPTPQGAELLKKYAASTDAKQAEAAKGIIAKREKMADIKSKPIELQFTATNGKDVDLALMRGKVVLVQFWASADGPSMAEMPNVISTYRQLHPKGFEIVGISLDQDKDAMQVTMKKHGMEWAQYFDGAGWKNKISSGFGIESIPAAWLIDKKGRLRETGLRGEALGQAVAKLLAE